MTDVPKPPDAQTKPQRQHQSHRPGLGRVDTSNDFFGANASVRDDGRVNIHLADKASKVTKYLESRTRPLHHGKAQLGVDLTSKNKKYETRFQTVLSKYSGLPKLNIAVFIVGSRGDVQPFIPIANILVSYGHRVRICTHPVFKDFVEENGLEFFSIGGDPANLMAYMVKNPGLMPGMESLKAGDVGKRRAEIAEILEGCWRGCIEPGDGMGAKTTVSLIRSVDPSELFVADAIIANPPSYAHIHCSEKLGIPLHLMFTMPWSPTQYFPHPLASMDRHDDDPNFANYISYTMMELLAWQGLGDVINSFRQKRLHLDPISPLWGHMLISRMKVPFTYLWSSELIPKPPDWGVHINISGFSFLDQSKKYAPPEDLAAFLKAGPPPIYIGFGSIVVDKPEELTQMIFGAVKRCGVRALVSKGWGGLGGDLAPDNVFLLGNCPHDWLFPQVSCVIHHGGAGTTAIGIACGKPTVIVPFFGDQPFWGAMIYRAGAGPEPIPFKKMTQDTLVQSITTALGDDIQRDVSVMAKKIEKEDGAGGAAKAFCEALHGDSMRCLIRPDEVAVWRIKKTKIRLGTLATAVLIDNDLLRLTDLKLIKHRNWYVDEGAGDPILGIVAAGSATLTASISSIVEYTKDLHHTLHRKSPKYKSGNTTSSASSSDNVDDEDPAVLARRESLDYVPSSRPVTKARYYSPQHLEGVAYRMAAKTLPTKKPGEGKPKTIRSMSWPVSRRTSRIDSMVSVRAQGHEHGVMHDAAFETGHFAHSILSTGIKVPVSLFYNLANGFHNAPSFYLSDTTVRRRSNITGIGSGLQCAGKELSLGLYDGLTGLVTQPYRGARSEGLTGFGKGVGRGIGGLVFKTGAAVCGVPGYTLKGVERQIEKRYDRVLKAGLITVRLRQGIDALAKSDEADREMVLKRWKETVGAGAWGSGTGASVSTGGRGRGSSNVVQSEKVKTQSQGERVMGEGVRVEEDKMGQLKREQLEHQRHQREHRAKMEEVRAA